MSVWCNPAAADEAGYLVDHCNNSNYGYGLFWQSASPDKLGVIYGTSTGYSIDVASNAVFVDTAVLVHVTAVFNSDKTVIFYRNGASAGGGTMAAYSPGVGAAQLCIGNRSGGVTTTTRFAGIIDEARVYNVACSPANILAQYMSGVGTLLSLGAQEDVYLRSSYRPTYRRIGSTGTTNL
jgi:hypothetical protein